MRGEGTHCNQEPPMGSDFRHVHAVDSGVIILRTRNIHEHVQIDV